MDDTMYVDEWETKQARTLQLEASLTFFGDVKHDIVIIIVESEKNI